MSGTRSPGRKVYGAARRPRAGPRWRGARLPLAAGVSGRDGGGRIRRGARQSALGAHQAPGAGVLRRPRPGDRAGAECGGARQADREAQGAAPGTRERALYEEFETAKRTAEASSVFARVPAEEGGRFPLTGRGDVNTYALFAELFASLAVDARPRRRHSADWHRDRCDHGAVLRSARARKAGWCGLIDFENRDRVIPGGRQPHEILPADNRSRREASPISPSSSPIPASLPSPSAASRSRPRNRAHQPEHQDGARLPLPRRRRADSENLRSRAVLDRLKPRGKSGNKGNPWNVDIRTTAIYSRQRGFRTVPRHADLAPVARKRDHWVLDGLSFRATIMLRVGRWLPLNEGEDVWIYDHRFATMRSRSSTCHNGQRAHDPSFEPQPLYWVHEHYFEERLQRLRVRHRSLCSGSDGYQAHKRTNACREQPSFRAHNLRLILFFTKQARDSAIILSTLNSVVVDYTIRNKLGEPPSLRQIYNFPFFRPPSTPPSISPSSSRASSSSPTPAIPWRRSPATSAMTARRSTGTRIAARCSAPSSTPATPAPTASPATNCATSSTPPT